MSVRKVYLAAPYAARDRVKRCAEELERIGYIVTSSWLDEKQGVTPGTVGAAPDLADDKAAELASVDLNDVGRSHVFILFTALALDIEGSTGTSGGRHVETGYAIAKGLDIVVVGQPENIFHRGIGLVCFPDWHAAVVHLSGHLVHHALRTPQPEVAP